MWKNYLLLWNWQILTITFFMVATLSFWQIYWSTMSWELCLNPPLYGLLIPTDGRGGWKPPPLLNYFLMVEFAVFYDTTLYIWIAPTKIQKMRVLGKKLWILWQIETKFWNLRNCFVRSLIMNEWKLFPVLCIKYMRYKINQIIVPELCCCAGFDILCKNRENDS